MPVRSDVGKSFRSYAAQRKNRMGKITAIHAQKLKNLSLEQEKPVRTKSRILTVEEGLDIPKHILEFLSYGPKHPTMTKFDANLFQAQVENVVSRLLEEDKESSWVKDVNALALQYARKCKKRNPSRILLSEQEYLKENLLAIP